MSCRVVGKESRHLFPSLATNQPPPRADGGMNPVKTVMPVPACMRDCVKVVVDRVVLCHFSSILPANTGRDGI